MTAVGGGRRFLVSVGVSTYQDSSIPNLPGATADAERVAELLAPMGYTRVLEGLSRNPSRNALVEGLDEWAFEAGLGPEDVVVVYFAGHGRKNGHKHYLLCANHRPQLWTTAVKSDDFAEPLVQSPLGHLLIILDTCFASAGTESVAVLATQLTDRRRGSAQRSVIAAARGKETAKENKFVDALAHVLARPQAGPSQRYLSVREVTARINECLDSPRQHASHSVVDSAGQDPFFDNRFFVPTADHNGLDMKVLADLQRQHEGHYGPRGRGLEHAGERGSYFTGRVGALTSLAEWLKGPHDRKARVITGDPGSGKSALLGRFLELTDAQHPARTATPDAGWLPPHGRDIIRLWARRVSGTDLVRDLAAAICVPDADRDQVLKALGERTDQVVVVIDSLDEAGTAGDPSEGRRIARELLQPLSALPAVRLVIGTRRDLLPALGHAIKVLDLDDDELTREAVTDYACAVLLDAHDPSSLSPYRHDPALARTVAEGIVTQAGRSFLVARMNARALVHRQQVVDTSEEGWELSLPSDAKEAFAAYLDRFGAGRQKVVRLLRPLAYAQGEGLPWSTVWAPLAEGLSGIRCSNDDLDWLFEHAGSYITESDNGTGSVFRLYHETMAEYLREPKRSAEHHRALATSLSSLVPTDPASGEKDWATAHPYVLTHLSSHAAAGGVVDGLLTDPDYLVHAHPAALLRAVDSATGDQARKVASVYRTSAHLLPAHGAETRRDILSIDAARYGWSELSRRLARGRPWQVRWATGGLVHPAHRRTLTAGHVVRALCGVTIDNRPHVLIGGGTDSVSLWDLHSGACVLALDGHTTSVRAVATLTIDNTPHALTADYDVRLWDLRTGTCVRTLTGGNTGGGHMVLGVTIEGRPHAFTAGSDHRVCVWDLRTGERALALRGHSSPVRALATLTIDHTPHALTGGYDETVRLWDLRTGTCVRTLTQPDPVHSLAAITVNGRPHALVGGEGHSVSVWDLETGECTRELVGHDGAVWAVCALTLDGRPHALTAGDDETVRLWDLYTGTRVRTLTGHTHSVQALCAVTIDDRLHAVTGGFDASVRVWDLSSADATAPRGGHRDWVIDIGEATVNGRTHALTGSYDGSVRLWDLQDAACRVLSPPDANDRVLAVYGTTLDDRPHAAFCFRSGMRLWDLDTEECVHTYSDDYDLWAMSGNTIDGRPYALTVDDAGTLRLWDVRTRECLRTLAGATPEMGPMNTLSGIVIDERVHALTTGFRSSTVELWDLQAGERTIALAAEDGHDFSAVSGVVIGGRPHALTAGSDRTARLWDLRTARCVLVLSGHAGVVERVRGVTIDGRPHALTSGDDHTARLWDLHTGECTQVIGLPLTATAMAVVDNQILLGLANDLILLAPAPSKV